MTAPGLDTAEHLTVVAAVLESTAWPVHERGEVPGLDGNPGTVPPRYLLIDLERTFIPTERLAATASRTRWRLGVRPVAKQRSEVRAGLLHVSTSLESAQVVVAGESSTPITHESTTSPEPDGRSISAESAWTYVL